MIRTVANSAANMGVIAVMPLQAPPVLEALGGRAVGDDGVEVRPLPGGLDQRVGAG